MAIIEDILKLNEKSSKQTEMVKFRASTWWMVRLAHVDENLIDRFFESFEIGIMSTELSKDDVKHWHFIVTDPKFLHVEVVKDAIRSIWPSIKGNKQLYCKKARDYRQAQKYVVKDGDFKSKGISKSLMDDIISLSKRKIDVADEINIIEEKLILKEIDFAEFMVEYIQIKVLSENNLYPNHLEAYFRRMAIQCGFIDISDFVNRLIDVI